MAASSERAPHTHLEFLREIGGGIRQPRLAPRKAQKRLFLRARELAQNLPKPHHVFVARRNIARIPRVFAQVIDVNVAASAHHELELEAGWSD